MKLLTPIVFLLSLQIYAKEPCCKGHSYADKIGTTLGLAPSVISFLWNSGEILNHGLGYFGIGEHEEDTKTSEAVAQYWHGIEIALHGANLIFSGLDLSGHHIHSKKISIILTGINALGAFAQAQTAISRGTSWIGISMSLFSTLDFIGHLSSAWSSAKPLRELAGI